MNDMAEEYHKARMAELFQRYSRDERLSDAQFRSFVKCISLRAPSEADIARANELADLYGWERVEYPSPRTN